MSNIVRALSELGEVDFFLLAHSGTAQTSGVPADAPVARFGSAPPAPRTHPNLRPRARQLRWLVRDSVPFAVAMRDHSVVRSAFRAWCRPRYDIAWIGRPHSYFALGDALTGTPTIVDYDDLEGHKIDTWLGVAVDAQRLSRSDRRSAPVPIIRRWGAKVFNRANSQRWRALEHRIAGSVAAVTVCSELDRQRLGVPNAVVLPNGYPSPRRPLGRVELRHPMTILLVGALCYAPNVDAARFLVGEVLPRVRDRLPQTCVRLVGEFDDRVEDLRTSPGVTLTGPVPDMEAELARADIVAVPIRFGSGTRVKILEAFAHRIPVVSTGLGCEGLGVSHGQHLLVADDADRFAAACVSLCEDIELRSRLVDEAHRLYRNAYRWEVISPRVVELARTVAGGEETRRLAVSRET